MSQTLTVELPDGLAQQARRLAAAHQRRLEDAVVDWISRAVAEPDVETLPNEEVLALCDRQLDDAPQTELSELLTRQREGELTADQQRRLDEVLGEYRQGMVLKARAWRTAVARGLRPPLNEHAA